MNEEKIQILTESIAGRKQEIMHYQINIDNYVFAIEDIEQNPNADDDMLAFKATLQDLLASSKREQTKSKIILKALEAQLASLS